MSASKMRREREKNKNEKLESEAIEWNEKGKKKKNKQTNIDMHWFELFELKWRIGAGQWIFKNVQTKGKTSKQSDVAKKLWFAQ